MNGKKIFIYIHKIEHFFSLSTWRFHCWHPWRCCCYVHVSIYLFWICKAFIFSEFDKNWRLVILTAIRNNLTTSLQFRLAMFNFRKSNVRSENCIIMSIMSSWTTLKYFRLDLEIFYAYTDSQRDCGESCILTLQNGLHIGWFNLNNSQHIGLLKQFLFLFSVCLTETII